MKIQTVREKCAAESVKGEKETLLSIFLVPGCQWIKAGRFACPIPFK